MFLLVLTSASISRAGKIDKAFVALREYNYFKAKDLFEKSIKKYESPASYGLALIYYRNDNPFNDLDSSFRYILKSERTYSSLKDKKKVHFREYAFDYLNILELRSKISSQFYIRANQKNTVLAYTNFIKDHPWSNELFTATYKRDSIAYSFAKEKNLAVEYQHFMQTYPESQFFVSAQEDFNRTQYQEYTKTNTLSAYLEFMKKCPENPYIFKAEDRIYEIVTETNTVASYYTFVQTYPKNRNVGESWRKLYQLYMRDYTDDRVEQFRKDYPMYPYQDELEEDLKYIKLKLLPFKSEALYGFMDYSGETIISAQYEQLGFFKEGLALAMKNGRFGYIDKGNRTIIPFIYDEATEFEQGRAIVTVKEKQGMIDRSGDIIFPLEFEDIGILSEGLIYAAKDSLYGYFDKNFNPRVSYKFDEAYTFIDGKAKVQIGEKQAFIDEYGTYVVPPGFGSISFFNDSLLIFEDDEYFGLMRKNCELVIQAQYDEIGILSLNRALVVYEDQVGYVDGAGKLVIKTLYETFPNYVKRGQFKSNLAIVKLRGKYGIIDQNGKVILPISFTDIGDVSSLIAFSKGKGWGFMDQTGKIILPAEYDFAESFVKGLAVVEKLTLQGVIDPKGKIIIPLSYTSVYRLNDELFMVSNGSRLGVYSTKGEMLIPAEYQQIMQVDKDLLLLTNNSEVHYLYLPEKRIIEPK